MSYLPYENITFKTALNPEEVQSRLAEAIQPNRTFSMKGVWGSKNHKPYEGSINGMSFNISRIIGYKNSFLPSIKGNIEKDFPGTAIHVKMRLNPFVLVFMFVWCGGVGLALIAVISVSIRNGTIEPTILVPLAMLLFGYGLTTGGFKYESKRSKKDLAELFEAER